MKPQRHACEVGVAQRRPGTCAWNGRRSSSQKRVSTSAKRALQRRVGAGPRRPAPARRSKVARRSSCVQRSSKRGRRACARRRAGASNAAWYSAEAPVEQVLDRRRGRGRPWSGSGAPARPARRRRAARPRWCSSPAHPSSIRHSIVASSSRVRVAALRSACFTMQPLCAPTNKQSSLYVIVPTDRRTQMEWGPGAKGVGPGADF